MSHIECPACKTRNHTTIYGCGCPFVGLGLRTVCDDCDLLLELVPDTDGLGTSEARRLKSKAFAALAPYRKAAGILPHRRDRVRLPKPTWKQRIERASGFRSWCRRNGVTLADLLQADLLLPEPKFDRKRWKP